MEEDSHESFVIANEATEFTFCKTARKPYDAVVCAVLILAKAYFGKNIEISSDGDWAEWQEGKDLLVELVEDVKDEDITCVFSGDDYSDNTFISAYV